MLLLLISCDIVVTSLDNAYLLIEGGQGTPAPPRQDIILTCYNSMYFYILMIIRD